MFPSPTGRELSDATLSKLLRENGIPAVPHGYGSSFRDWAAELTNTPREICELALAHVNNDRVEAAYQRSDLFDHRRQLVQHSAQYLRHPIQRTRTVGERRLRVPAAGYTTASLVPFARADRHAITKQRPKL